MLDVGGHDLVLGPEAEAGEHDVAGVRGRGRERDVAPAATPSSRRELRAHLRRAGRARASKYAAPPRPCSRSRRSCSAIASTVARGERPVRARVQVRVALEDRELRLGPPRPVKRSSPPRARDRTAARPSTSRRSSGQRCACPARRRGRGSGRSRDRLREAPLRRCRQRGSERSRMMLKSPASTSTSPGSATPSAKTAARSSSASATRLRGGSWRASWRRGQRPRARADGLADAALLGPGRRSGGRRSRSREPAPAEARRLSTIESSPSDRSSGCSRIAFAWPVSAERKRPVVERGRQPAERRSFEAGGRAAIAPKTCIPLQSREPLERPGRQLLQAEDVRPVVARQPDHLLEIRRAARAGSRCRERRSRCGRAGSGRASVGGAAQAAASPT